MHALLWLGHIIYVNDTRSFRTTCSGGKGTGIRFQPWNSNDTALVDFTYRGFVKQRRSPNSRQGVGVNQNSFQRPDSSAELR